jgi:class 3 adenylate cyclase
MRHENLIRAAARRLLSISVMDKAATDISAFGVPAGTVTFLLTDVEGPTRQWENAPTAMPEAIARHCAILNEVVPRHGGVRPPEQGEGDSVIAAFSRARDAVGAALDAQRMLLAEEWPAGAQLRVRMALHTGDAQLRDDGHYFGAAVTRCAQLLVVANGTQVLLSGATAELVSDHLPDGAELISLGVHRLRDLGRGIGTTHGRRARLDGRSRSSSVASAQKPAARYRAHGAESTSRSPTSASDVARTPTARGGTFEDAERRLWVLFSRRLDLGAADFDDLRRCVKVGSQIAGAGAPTGPV